jgi:hypothetical protein
MLACACWIGSALIAAGILAGVVALGVWRHRRATRGSKAEL